MTARTSFLRGIRQALGGSRTVHPGRYEPASIESTSWARFAEALRSVGGTALGPVRRSALPLALSEICSARAGERIVAAASAAALLGEGPWTPLDGGEPPHSLADVGLAIVEGIIGVCENAAVAVDGVRAPTRALPFLCEELVLVLRVEALVVDMHAAFRVMSEDALTSHHFTWISGPSKTADIEQTLVLGAHGPRALSVIGLEGP